MENNDLNVMKALKDIKVVLKALMYVCAFIVAFYSAMLVVIFVINQGWTVDWKHHPKKIESSIHKG